MTKLSKAVSEPIKLDEILEALLGKYDSLAARIRHIDFSINDTYPRISVRGSYLSFRDGLPTTEDFVTMVHRRITSFCLPRNELKALHELAVTKSPDQAAELWTAAVARASERYIKAKKGSHRSGEATEIILFILLEWILKAPQIVSKMYLKTNNDMPVHGTDGIHARYDSQSGDLFLYWGESKAHQTLASALSSAMASLVEFIEKAKEEKEIDIIHAHADLGDMTPQEKSALLDFFDPIKEESNKRKPVFACLLVFDDPNLSKVTEHEKHFTEDFRALATLFIKSLQSQLESKGLFSRRFVFFYCLLVLFKHFEICFNKKSAGQMLDELADRVWSHQGFHDQTAILLQNHLRRSLLGQDIELSPPEWLNRLARSAAILSTSKDTERKLLAYRIASALAEYPKVEFAGLKYVLLIVLSRLGNFPGANFAKQRLEISDERLPIHLFGETEYRREGNTVSVNGRPLLLTDFQVELWRAFDESQDVSVSAPTSAGKSFVVQQCIRRAVLTGSVLKCAFIVPSRALITQVTDDVSAWINESEPPFEIVSIPLASEAKVPARAIFIMTQERLQLTLFNHKDLSFEIVVIDESHGLGDGPRGVLLTNVIDELRTRAQTTKLLFAGPNISNPKDVGNAFGIHPKDVSTRDQTVAQNIIFADVNSKSGKKIDLACLTEKGRIPLGNIESPIDLRTDRERLVFIPFLLGSSGQSLVYVLGPAQCEDIAFGLADALHAETTEYLLELSSFVADAVHPKYQLVNPIKSGVGFHYGRVPSLVRKEIEEAYSQGHLKFLVTTSTLLQGVNLPARNLFMLRPHKGDDNPISSIDFWNLAGRAGRLGKEFEGNVFLIDYDSWETKPLDGEKEAKVSNSFDTHVSERTSELISYIADPNAVPVRDQTDEFENTFVKLYAEFRRGNLQQRLQRSNVSAQIGSQILAALQEASNSISVPDEIFDACPTVSPYRQEALLNRIRTSIKRRGPEYVIPKHPLAPGAWASLTAMFKRCQDEVLRYATTDKTYVFITYLALRWMKGDPLPKIIEDSIRYKMRLGGNPNIPTVIRQTLTDVEHRRLRFE